MQKSNNCYINIHNARKLQLNPKQNYTFKSSGIILTKFQECLGEKDKSEVTHKGSGNNISESFGQEIHHSVVWLSLYQECNVVV